MFKIIRKQNEAQFQCNARLYSGQADEFKVGDLVWCFSSRKVPKKPGKITGAWMGPYQVTGKPADVVLEVKPTDTGGRTITIHVTKVRQCYGTSNDEKYRPPRDPIEDDDGDELAEKLGHPE